jgi:hypothetical protein
MKISKTVQRRTIIFATFAALIALFHVAHFTVQLFYSTNPYLEAKNYTFIGELDTQFESSKDFALTIERDAEGNPLVEALPSSMILYSKNPNYVRPEHFGWEANKIMMYATLVLFIAITVITSWVLISAIRGFRTGNIFRKNHPALLRWLALCCFFYFTILNNREVFRQLATKEIYGNLSPIELFGSVQIGAEVLTAPLLLLIFAELMKVAAQINEDEAMTI